MNAPLRVGLLALTLSVLCAPTTSAVAGVQVAERESYVQAAGWRTVASLWNASARGVFRGPSGAQIRVRYGGGWFSSNRQHQTLDGFNEKYLNVGRGSVFYARMQVKVRYDTWVSWLYIPT
jgi:hypothetical protein